MNNIKTPSITSDNDIVVINNSLVFVDGKDAYANIIKAAILTLEGEIKSFSNLGIPYFSTVFDSPTKVDEWDLYVRSKINSYDFVSSIESMTHTISNHVLSYKAVINTDLGEITVAFNTVIS